MKLKEDTYAYVKNGHHKSAVARHLLERRHNPHNVDIELFYIMPPKNQHSTNWSNSKW